MKKVMMLLAVVVISLFASVAVMAEPMPLFDDAEKSLTFDGTTMAKDFEGKDTLLFIFTYTNKTSEGKMPLTEVFMTVYQRGISLDTAILMDSNYSDLTAASLKQVKDGASLQYCVGYILNDMSSDLEVEVTDSLFGGDTQTFTVSLGGSTDTGSIGETKEVDWEAKYNDLLEQYNALEAKYNEIVALVQGTEE